MSQCVCAFTEDQTKWRKEKQEEGCSEERDGGTVRETDESEVSVEKFMITRRHFLGFDVRVLAVVFKVTCNITFTPCHYKKVRSGNLKNLN